MSPRCPSEDRRLALGLLALGALAWLVPVGVRWASRRSASDLAPEAVRLPGGWRGLLHGEPLDLNGATFDDLLALPGVGPSTARAILGDRAARGPFLRVEDLTRVSGVGPKTLERLRPFLRVAVRNDPLPFATRPRLGHPGGGASRRPATGR